MTNDCTVKKEYKIINSVSDPHWFQCGLGSGTSFLPQSGSRERKRTYADLDPDPGQTLPLQKI
jgi:hypothetical protein